MRANPSPKSSPPVNDNGRGLSIPGFGPVRQLGHVVPDIDGGMREWQEQGIGPWMVMRNVHLNAIYLGEPSVPVIDVALSYQGNVQIELIRQHNDAPSPYLQAIREDSYGLHHRACLVDNINAVVDGALNWGLEMVCDIHMMGSRYVYLRHGAEFVELLPNSLMMRGMFASGMRACRRHPGRDMLIDIDMNNPATLVRSLPSAVAGLWCQQLR